MADEVGPEEGATAGKWAVPTAHMREFCQLHTVSLILFSLWFLPRFFPPARPLFLLFPPAFLTFFFHLFHFIKLLVCYCYRSSVWGVGFFYKWSACLLNRNCVSLNSAALSCAVKALDCELLGVSNPWHRPQSCLESRAEVESWDSKEPRSSAGWADSCAPQTSLEWIRVERSLWNSDPSSISPSQELRLSK